MSGFVSGSIYSSRSSQQHYKYFFLLLENVFKRLSSEKGGRCYRRKKTYKCDLIISNFLLCVFVEIA